MKYPKRICQYKHAKQKKSTFATGNTTKGCAAGAI